MPKSAPAYPYYKRTNTITLPAAISHEIFHLAQNAGKPEVVKRVMELTGAELKLVKDYVEAIYKAR